MIYQIFPEKDATIYEYYEKANTGLDAILELTKVIESDVDINNNIVTKSYPSRILIKFDYSDFNDLVEAGYDTGSINTKYVLKLFSTNTDTSDLPASYNIEVAMISSSWSMGLGEFEYVPKSEDGVSWKYKTGTAASSSWPTVYSPESTGSFFTNPGGGSWFTSSIVSKSFDYNVNTDLELDITDLVKKQLLSSSLYPNEGFILKRPYNEEFGVEDSMKLKFFSIDTNTIYIPNILVKIDDTYFNTGSFSPIIQDDENTIYFKNLNTTYTNNDRIKFRIHGREKYPVKTFSTSSNYDIVKYLPISSSYSIEDLHTKEIVIPHDYTYTRINCDPVYGSYFNFWMGCLQPERYYKFIIKTKFDNSDVRIYDNNFIFKVTRPI